MDFWSRWENFPSMTSPSPFRHKLSELEKLINFQFAFGAHEHGFLVTKKFNEIAVEQQGMKLFDA